MKSCFLVLLAHGVAGLWQSVRYPDMCATWSGQVMVLRSCSTNPEPNFRRNTYKLRSNGKTGEGQIVWDALEICLKAKSSSELVWAKCSTSTASEQIFKQISSSSPASSSSAAYSTVPAPTPVMPETSEMASFSGPDLSTNAGRSIPRAVGSSTWTSPTPRLVSRTVPPSPPAAWTMPEPTTKSELSNEDDLFRPNTLRQYNIEFTQNDWATMNADVVTETYVPCKITIDYKTDKAQTFHDVGCRYKGSIGSLRGCIDPRTKQNNGHCRKFSLKVDANKYQTSQFDSSGKEIDEDNQRIRGLDKVMFHGMPVDSSLLAEMTAYDMFNTVGAASARAVHAIVHYNHNFDGVYVMVESIDDRFTKRVFADDENKGKGGLYKEVLPKFSGWMSRLYTEHHEEGKKEETFLVEVATALDAAVRGYTSASSALRVLEQYFDVDQLVDIIAVNEILGQTDDWRYRHNFFLYIREDKMGEDSNGNDITSKKIVVVPWDYDRLNDQDVQRRGLPSYSTIDPFSQNAPRAEGFGTRATWLTPTPSSRCAVPPNALANSRPGTFEYLIKDELPPEDGLPISCDAFTKLMAVALPSKLKQRIAEISSTAASNAVLSAKWRTWSSLIAPYVDHPQNKLSAVKWTQGKLGLANYIMSSREAAKYKF